MSENVKRKLTSRKLWLAVAGFVSMMLVYLGHAESEAESVASLIMAGASVIGYIVGEGLVDSKNAGKDETATEAEVKDPAIGFVIPGPDEYIESKLKNGN